jgi:hypothetical protein
MYNMVNFRLNTYNDQTGNDVANPTVDFLGNAAAALTATGAVSLEGVETVSASTQIGNILITIPKVAWEGLHVMHFTELDESTAVDGDDASDAVKAFMCGNKYNDADITNIASSGAKASNFNFLPKPSEFTFDASPQSTDTSSSLQAEVTFQSPASGVVSLDSEPLAANGPAFIANSIFGDISLMSILGNEKAIQNAIKSPLTALDTKAADDSELGTACGDTQTAGDMTSTADNIFDSDNDGDANKGSTNLTMQLLLLFLTKVATGADLRARLDARMEDAANLITTAGGMSAMTNNAWVDDSNGYAAVCKVSDGVLVALPLQTNDTFTFNIQYTMDNYASPFTHPDGTAASLANDGKMHISFEIKLG